MTGSEMPMRHLGKGNGAGSERGETVGTVASPTSSRMSVDLESMGNRKKGSSSGRKRGGKPWSSRGEGGTLPRLLELNL